MRLSEAIRLGAMIRPQTRAKFFDETGTCAFGAALDACDQLHADPMDGKQNTWMRREWPLLFDTCAPCPVCGCVDEFFWVVVELNDRHRWTREQIADWVETLEANETTSPSVADRQVVSE